MARWPPGSSIVLTSPKTSLVQRGVGLLARQKVRYLIAGGWNTLFGVGTSFLLYWLLHQRIHYMVILIIGNIIAVTMAYVSYKLFVFRTRGNILVEYLRFYMVYGVGIVVGLVASPFCIEVLGMNFYVSQLLILIVTVASSFIAHKRFSFKTSRTDAV